MNYNEIIVKKENDQLLNYEELDYVFNGYLNGKVSDADMTRLLKAICKYSLTEEETYNLTDIFIKSGDILDLSSLGIVVDKHSTGGVGDKITLIIAPIVASIGVRIAKMSGRGLGHTGGTIDKLESIKGFDTSLSKDEFINEIKDINVAITSQTANVVPMDKKVYALRDVTGTTKSIPLIASSIMSKKIACGANKILIDVKVGSGALLETIEEAEELSKLMINIGKKYDREVICMLTDMNSPLGSNIGNSLEVIEAINVLQGRGEKRLVSLSKIMASYLVSMAKNISFEDASLLVEDSIKSGNAYSKFIELVTRQHGNINNIVIDNKKIEVYSREEGYISKIDTYGLGLLSCKMGAGRVHKEDEIDYGSGIVLNKQIGDYAKSNELLCTLYTKKDIIDEEVLKLFTFSQVSVKGNPLIYQTIK